MAKTYSMDLRTRGMNDIHNGHFERKTAEKFGVSRQWIQQLKRQEINRHI
jgi:transposase